MLAVQGISKTLLRNVESILRSLVLFSNTRPRFYLMMGIIMLVNN